MNIGDAIREKAQGSTDAAFWKVVANDLERNRAAIAELVGVVNNLLQQAEDRLWPDEDLAHAYAVIAKYDKKGSA